MSYILMDLVIVESPTKARTLSRFLGSNFRIEATLGHIRDLPENKLGVDIEHDFKPFYVISPAKKKNVLELKKIAKNFPKIILATDPDREGEAIAYHIAVILGLVSKNTSEVSPHAKRGGPSTSEVKSGVERIVFHEITKSAINEALKHPREIDMNLVNAQQARRILDRLVGYKLSPLLWVKVRKGLSAGRVQSVTVRLIVEREREIEAFVPQEYWIIEVELEKSRLVSRSKGRLGSNLRHTSKVSPLATCGKRGPFTLEVGGEKKGSFTARLIKIDEKKVEIKNRKQADEVVFNLNKASYKVLDIAQKELKKHPYPPFKTSTLQSTAANLFGWSAKKTMQIAQRLYEQGFITYHRTDSFNLASAAIKTARQFIKEKFGEKYLPERPNIYKTKSKVAQEAHEAIRPTKIKEIANFKLLVSKEINKNAARLYELIWKRFLACQTKEAVDLETKVEIEAKNSKTYLLQAKGIREKFDGWRVIYTQNKREDIKKKKEEEIKVLPELKTGESLDLIRVMPTQKFTQPPPRFTEATLIKALEEKGIGRPSTYAPIISTICERQYVERQERKFKPTLLGIAVNDFLVKNFDQIINVSFTAKMEDELDQIAKGEEKWAPVVEKFYHPFEKRLKEVFEKSKRVKVGVEKTEEICPKCGSKVVVRIGKYGKFLACSKFPECDYTASYIEKTGLSCPKCGGELIIKRTKKGRRFYGCSNYPKCNFASWRKPSTKGSDSSTEKGPS